MIPVQMPTPPIPSEVEQEEARRQAAAQGSPDLDGVGDAVGTVAEAVADGTLGVVVDAAGQALGATIEVAKASLEVVGGILGALDGL